MNFLLVCLELTINIGFYSLVPDTDTGIDPDPGTWHKARFTPSTRSKNPSQVQLGNTFNYNEVNTLAVIHIEQKLFFLVE